MSRFEVDLTNLRSGKLSYTDFASRNRRRFRKWANYYIQRFHPHGLDIEDLVQEGLIEAWHSVDRWEEGRGPTLERFVHYHVGERMDREVKRVLGWPRTDRDKPATQVFAPAAIDFVASGFMSALKRLELEGAVDTLSDPLERAATAGVGLGGSVRVIAAHLYADPATRLQFEFDSRDHAIRKVRSAVKRATKTLVDRRSVSVNPVFH
jgi:DNA-directed RNA polymerase specialized sigma24 family protein